MMKLIRFYAVLILLNVNVLSYAVYLPQNPYYSSNALYEEGFDEIEYEIGTKIRNINMIISTVQEEWGNHCLGVSFGEQGKCQDCCDNQWAGEGYEDQYEDKYYTCINMCDGGQSLPLGSSLWLLPFVFAYGIYKRVRMNTLTTNNSKK